jgi:hypothetical protein
MRLMKEGGIGGFEVQPVYPLSLDDESRGIRNLAYLSPEFLDALRFTAGKAHELGLRFDLTLGSGWPFGGPWVDVGRAAATLRCEKVAPTPGSRRVPVPALSAGESLVAAFSSEDRKELTDVRDDALWLPEGAPPPSQVWFFVAGRTGQMVKRAARGSEGFVFDHYDRAALDGYLESVGEPLLRAVGGHPPYAVFCDSLEVYGNDWTGDLLREFRRRRGYDLRLHLPALVDESDAGAAAVRRDRALTLSELFEERFIAPLRDWARAHGTLLRMQDYGTPPARLSSNVHVDLSEGEGGQWRELTAARWASSASHLFGRSVTSSETWTWLHSPVFRATPLDLKAEADRHVLQGINQFIGHGWPYTPEGVSYPGWRFYAAGVFDDKNPWWHVMPDLSLYLQRLSFLMREGRPANDVALYLPDDDALAHLPPGDVNLIRVLGQRLGPEIIGRILDAGYGFDLVDDRALREIGRVGDGALVFGESRYRVVVLPSVERISPESLARLEELARAGAGVVATRRTPLVPPGLAGVAGPDGAAGLKERVARLFARPSSGARLVADETQLGALLNQLLPPDLRLSPPAPDVGFVHRTVGDAEVYFLANTGNRPVRADATFRVRGLSPEWWEPLSGEVGSASVVARAHGGVTVSLELAPYGSRVLVFGPRRVAPWRETVSSAATVLADLSRGWDVRFEGLGETLRMDDLRSWTDREATRYYSGLATYERTFSLAEDALQADARIVLSLGEATPTSEEPGTRWGRGSGAAVDAPVRESAVVTVNGRRAGTVWCPPYSLDVTAYLRPGPNHLAIAVGNLALNHMAGRALPDYRLLTLRYGERFQPQDMERVEALPAGLFGPVRLLSIGPEKRSRGGPPAPPDRGLDPSATGRGPSRWA